GRPHPFGAAGVLGGGQGLVVVGVGGLAVEVEVGGDGGEVSVVACCVGGCDAAGGGYGYGVAEFWGLGLDVQTVVVAALDEGGHGYGLLDALALGEFPGEVEVVDRHVEVVRDLDGALVVGGVHGGDGVLDGARGRGG